MEIELGTFTVKKSRRDFKAEWWIREIIRIQHLQLDFPNESIF